MEIPLTAGWNLIGNPYEALEVSGEHMRFESGGESLTVEQAVGRGWAAADMFEHDNATGRYERRRLGDPLEPWKGYAVKAGQACVLIIQP